MTDRYFVVRKEIELYCKEIIKTVARVNEKAEDIEDLAESILEHSMAIRSSCFDLIRLTFRPADVSLVDMRGGDKRE